MIGTTEIDTDVIDIDLLAVTITEGQYFQPVPIQRP